MKQVLTVLIIATSYEYIENLEKSLAIYAELRVIDKSINLQEAAEMALQNKPDIIFCQIEFDDKKIFSLLETLLNFYQYPAIVFIHSNKDYAYETIKYRPFDYLIEPFSDEDLRLVVHKLTAQVQTHRKNYFIVSLQGYEYVIKIDDIIFFQAQDGEVKVVLSKNESYFTNSTIAELEKTFYHRNFYKTHRSFLINLDYLRTIKRTKLKSEAVLIKANEVFNVKITDLIVNSLRKIFR